jgi:hypothetical protein
MTEDNKYKFICDKCNYKTNLKSLILQHNETELHKTGERGKKPIKEKEIFKCSDCEFYSTNKNNYLTHKLNNHSTKEERKKQFKYYCDSCDFGVFTESSFEKHKNSLRHTRLNK